MSNGGMLMTVRAHNAAGSVAYGPGGPRCSCCGPSPKDRVRERRQVKRAERRLWEREDWGV